MNKNEFYKQLMSEYSFDADKIRENAKRGKNARQKLQPMYIGMTAAAAALVVTVGTLAAVNLTKDNGVSLTDSGLATLSANDRVIHAIEQLEKERGSEESKDFLVNFAAPMSPAEVQETVENWRDQILAAISQPDQPPYTPWPEDNEKPYYTDKPDWDAFGAMLLVAACHTYEEPVPPTVEKDWDFGEHPLICLLYTSPSPRD